MIKATNKFFDASKLPDVSFPVYTTTTPSYTDFFPESQIEVVSGNNIERKKYRLKPEYQMQMSTKVTLNPVMQGVITLMDSNPNLKGTYIITSTVREPRYEGDTSHHIKGMAFDIVPKDGDFQKLQQEIAKDTNLVNYLQKNNLGIIVEVGPDARAKYKATGDNLHFGPDKDAVAGLPKLISEFSV